MFDNRIARFYDDSGKLISNPQKAASEPECSPAKVELTAILIDSAGNSNRIVLSPQPSPSDLVEDAMATYRKGEFKFGPGVTIGLKWWFIEPMVLAGYSGKTMKVIGYTKEGNYVLDVEGQREHHFKYNIELHCCRPIKSFLKGLFGILE